MKVIVGMCPSHGTKALEPSGGKASSADRLVALSGMPVDEFKREFHRVNVLPSPVWERGAARQRGTGLARSLCRDRATVFVLGREAWWALGLPPVPWFTSSSIFTLLPHPSGRNRLLNDPDLRHKFREALR